MPHIAQVAFSVMDLDKTHAFYRLLGFEPAGGTAGFRGPVTAKVQGLPESASICWWMVDQRGFMQLELFAFERPPMRGLPTDWRACDIGYTTLGVHVGDFDGVIGALAAAGFTTLTPALGLDGARRVCVRDPDGVLVEVMEDDPRPVGASPRVRPEIGAVARYVTLSVPDLARARRFWVDTVGLEEAHDVRLHDSEHEALWGLAGADCERLLLWANDFLVELVCYAEPLGRPWPQDYRISDQGILNVALGTRDMAEMRALYDALMKAGYSSESDIFPIGDGGCVYCRDDQGFSLELLCSADPDMDERVGFKPRPTGELTSGRKLSG